MENGTVWGHGAYLGPDFSAEYLHTLDHDIDAVLAQELFKTDFGSLNAAQQDAVHDQTETLLKQNRVVSL